MLDINEIMKILPHRYPFLLVDRVVEHEPGKKIVGLKNVTINEPFFPGHFPGHPVMPGVLQIEAMAQVGIAGSSKLGDHVILTGQVGLAGHLEIGANTMVGAKSGVSGSLPANGMFSGIPAIPHREWLRAIGTIPKLPDMRKTVNALEKRVQELEEKLTSQLET